MNRARTATAALTLAAVSLLAPAVASAEPTFSITTNGSPVESGTTGNLGQIFEMAADGCLTLEGQPGYVGQFVSWPDEPDRPVDHFEILTDELGHFNTQTEVMAMDHVERLGINWYCASSPATDMDSPSMMWVSPTYEVTIDATSGQQPLKTVMRSKATTSSAGRRSVAGRASDAPEAIATVSISPDALPLVDRMGILGPKAAKLKKATDAKLAIDLRVQNALRRVLGRPNRSSATTSTEYAKAAFATTTGKVPSAKVLKPYVARLDRGDLRVQVVEEIALTAHDAAWWNRKA